MSLPVRPAMYILLEPYIEIPDPESLEEVFSTKSKLSTVTIVSSSVCVLLAISYTIAFKLCDPLLADVVFQRKR